MQLTSENYYSQEANQEYMSVYTAAQNTKMVNLLKKGKLIKA